MQVQLLEIVFVSAVVETVAVAVETAAPDKDSDIAAGIEQGPWQVVADSMKFVVDWLLSVAGFFPSPLLAWEVHSFSKLLVPGIDSRNVVNRQVVE